MQNNIKLHEWMWWTKGKCVVRVLKAGHYPTTVMVKLPNDTESEIEICELEFNGASNGKNT